VTRFGSYRIRGRCLGGWAGRAAGGRVRWWGLRPGRVPSPPDGLLCPLTYRSRPPGRPAEQQHPLRSQPFPDAHNRPIQRHNWSTGWPPAPTQS